METQLDQKTIRINRLKLLAIFGVALIPLLIAFVMYFGNWIVPDAKTNKGTLLWPPVSITQIDSPAQGINQMSLAEIIENEKTWMLMITGKGECDEACNKLLYTVRQVNIAMGREIDRVGRILVTSTDQVALEELQQVYPGMKTYPVSSEQLNAFQQAASLVETKESKTVPWNVWLVDPLGNVILHYTDEHDGYDMIDDLKRVLKLSNIG